MHLEMLSVKWQLFCRGLSVLMPFSVLALTLIAETSNRYIAEICGAITGNSLI